MTRIYKLLAEADWSAALGAGVYEGSADDRRDGFIHFSTADQAGETARKYFSGRTDLLLVAFEAETLGGGLKWEPSRGGALFPHLYGPLRTDAAIDVRVVTLGPDGAPDLGPLQP